MKIALIARGCRPGAGIEKYTFELAKGLSAKHQVSVLTNPGEYQDCGATLVPIKVQEKPKWYSIWKFSYLAGQLAWQGDYDIVHTQGSDGIWGDVVTAHSCHLGGMRASLKFDSSVFNHLRKLFSPAHRSVLIREKQALLSARRLITVSHRVARQLKATYPAIVNKSMQVIYPGVARHGMANESISRSRKEIRDTYKINDKTVLFVLVANDPIFKGAKRLIQALAQCREKNIGLLIVSSLGNNFRLRREAEKHGVKEKVHFAAMAKDATAAFLAADVYIGIPEYESFGLSFLEAMSFGKPVILSNNAGVAELLENKSDTVILPAHAKSNKIAEAMDRLTKDHLLRKKMGERMQTIADNHQWSSMINSIETIYAQVIKEKQGK